MQFRTELKYPKSKWDIDYNSKIISVGSCFSTNITERMSELQFDIVNNPYGTFYNPISIFRALNYTELDFENTFIERDGQWMSFLSHSDISANDRTSLTSLLKDRLKFLNQKIKSADYLILTLGSAKIYTHKKTDLIVANCHKVSQNEFDSRILTVKEITQAFRSMHSQLSKIKPEVKVIITVSPVRYLADGFEQNSISKAMLIASVHEILNEFDNVEYFPAYELVLDDLRDYRFYNEDLIHPNSIAVNYVFQKFSESYFNDSTKQIAHKVYKINKALNHIPFNRDADSYKKFLIDLKVKIDEISNHVDTTHFKERLAEK
ncbi:GSCFA domain-containing protein [Hyphobacterium sp. CCMP332]|nr:GSCFA domain-containing protein [Hyphobacterium sp. CCMP332]